MATLYHIHGCHECAQVRRLLRQKAIPFDSVVVPADDRSLAIAKFGGPSVPGLVDGRFVSNDLAAILRHLQR